MLNSWHRKQACAVLREHWACYQVQLFFVNALFYNLSYYLLSLFALLNLVTWLIDSETSFTWAVFHFALGKSKPEVSRGFSPLTHISTLVYVNSVLVS